MTRTLLPNKYNTPSDLGRTLTSILNTKHDGLFWVTMGGRSPGDPSHAHGIRHGRTRPWPPWKLGLGGCVWRLGKSGGRVCALEGMSQLKGCTMRMHNADALLDHKVILNLG
jgi:hypothetical protein